MNKLSITIAIGLLVSLNLSAQPLRLAVAANFKPTLEKLVGYYQSESRALSEVDGSIAQANINALKIDISSASTGVLYAQIVQGAPFDLFFSADSESVERLVRSDLTLPGYNGKYAIGQLVLWARRSQNLADAKLGLCQHKLVMANPRVAPYGVVAKQFLDRLINNQNNLCNPKQVIANNVAHGVQIAELGYVDYALMPLSLMRTRISDGKYWPVVVGDVALLQSMAVLKSTQNSKAAIQFFQFMQSDDAQSLIEKEGYHRIN